MKRMRWKVAQFFEILWWQRYTRKLDKEGYLQQKRLYWHRILGSCGELPAVAPTDTILDAGCGPAGIFIVFPDNRVTAVDPLLTQYAARIPLFRYDDHPGVRFINSTLEDFEPGEQYDRVFCLNAINHVRDIGAGYQRLSELVRPGGWLVLGVDAHNHNWLKPVFRALQFDILHPHQYDLDEYAEMTREVGFRVSSTSTVKTEYLFNYVLIVAQKL
jgi:SAM-dependent methyltransferase